MREEYDIKNLNPRKNPYSNRIKKQVTIKLDGEIIEYFKNQSESYGIPYQTLINLYLADCVKEKKQLQLSWK
ncbi:MAG: BrnA antitoxin family protein [Lachnospiraceae bacterium]|nr:BrnA antitoxin family protein [Lachnospiraceae bacterium]HCJ06952.1 antitoxin [Lachnospiraceae bacterium]